MDQRSAHGFSRVQKRRRLVRRRRDGRAVATRPARVPALGRVGAGGLTAVALVLLSPSATFGQTWQVVEYYDTDAIGSVRVVTDAAGAVVARHDFMPFGEELSPETPPHDRKLFTGQERDFETGQDYFGARQLRTDLGRFLAPDPITLVPRVVGAQGINSYAYVRNNPLGLIDPNGLDPTALQPEEGDCSWTSWSATAIGGVWGETGYAFTEPASGDETAIGPISGYPETDKDSWRASNDAVFTAAANAYNEANGLSPGDPLYISPKQLKAQAMIESGGNRTAFESDPLQVNVRGDFTTDKAQVTGLKVGQAMTPKMSAEASLKWPQHKTEIRDGKGSVIGYRSMHDALRNYNGNTRIYPNQGNLQHRDWYANQVLLLSR